MDPTLVLRYAFDHDPEGVARDLSSCGNDGKIVKARYLEEVSGRRGVLRFDGEEAVLTCPDSNSLFFGGDMSFEMWARLNGPVKATWATLFGDGENFDFYVVYWQQLVLWYTALDPVHGTESMVIPVERQILGDHWSHIAMVAEYPRCRFYHNGALIRDAYMPLKGMSDRHKTAKKIGLKSPLDLSEFRLYRRALTAAEVAAHAKGQETPPGRSEELAVEPHWYEKTVALRLVCKGSECKGQMVEMTLLKGDHSEAVASQRTTLAEAFEGSRRYVATVTFPLSGLEGKSLDGVAHVLGPDGQPVKKIFQHVSLKKPEWVDTREGYPDGVPPPWTPVTARKKSVGSVEVRVWGRRHVFGATPFPQQISSGGKELLTAPIIVSGRADGKTLVWRNGRVRLTGSSKTAALLEQVCEDPRATLRVNTSIEYDGYMIFDCELQTRRDLRIESLLLEIPLRTRYASLCYGDRVLPPNDEVPIAEFYSGAVRGDLAFRFSPTIWLGDEERGLCWQAESDEDWRNADRQKAIEIVPRGEETRFRAHLVDAPTRLRAGKAFHYRFALQATPIKPMLRDAWDLRVARSEPYGADLDLPDRKSGGKSTLQSYAEAGVGHLFINVNDLWPHPTPIHERFSRALRRLVSEAHACGLRLHPYLIHERFPTMAPEFDINGLNMSQRPMNQYIPGGNPPGDPRPGPVTHDYGADSQGTVFMCPKSKALQDACIHSLAKRLDEYGEDGVYLDGTAQTPPCQNFAHCCGYRAEDVSLRKTYPVFAIREFMKRIYTVVKQRRPEGIVDVHCSWGYNPPGLAYADILWTGEQWWHLRGKGAKDGYVARELPLDMFRTEFMGRQLGVAAETLAYRLGPQTKVAATSLLHDVPVRPSTTGLDQLKPTSPREDDLFVTMIKLWKARDQFGAKEAEKLFYWKNQDYVQVTPEKCYATLFKHPRNGVWAFISNLRRDAQNVSVQFNLDKLNLRGRKLNVFNVLTDEPVAMTPGGQLSVSLGSEEWVYLWLRPGTTEEKQRHVGP